MMQTKTLTQANAWQADRIEVLEARVAELEADNGRLCALVEKRLENRDGYTIIDFLRVWHDQQKARANKAEARVAELEGDAARYRWLRNRVTFYDIDADWPVDAPNVPVLAQVAERIWYHATDDIHSLSLDALIDAALAGKQPQEGE